MEGIEVRIGSKMLQIIVPVGDCQLEGVESLFQPTAERLATGEVVEYDGICGANLGVHPVDGECPLVSTEISQELSQNGEDFGIGGVLCENGLVEFDLEVILRPGENRFEVERGRVGTRRSGRNVRIARHGPNSCEGQLSRRDTTEIGWKGRGGIPRLPSGS